MTLSGHPWIINEIPTIKSRAVDSLGYSSTPKNFQTVYEGLLLATLRYIYNWHGKYLSSFIPNRKSLTRFLLDMKGIHFGCFLKV